MAKFCGAIGYSSTVEIRPGVWEERIRERRYVGDVLRDTRKWENGNNKNDNLVLNNRISIIADSFGYDNFFAMKYIRWCGVGDWLWDPFDFETGIIEKKGCLEITNVELCRPRIIITVGGIYHGN